MTTGKFNYSLLPQQENTLFVGLGVLLKISAEAEYLYLKFTEKPQAKILKNENYLLGIFLVHCCCFSFSLLSYNYFSMALYCHNNFYQPTNFIQPYLIHYRKGKCLIFFLFVETRKGGRFTSESPPPLN